MKHLVVICHPKRRSFTQTVAARYAGLLANMGNDVVIRDLYRMHFDPVLGERELAGKAGPRVPADVRREQRHLTQAGGIAFFYPLWWAYMPAMMKGYIDRVLTTGFAYNIRGDEFIPLLAGKKALIFTNSAADMTELRRSRQWRSMRSLEDNMLVPCGIELLDHIHFPSVLPDMPKRTFDRHLATVVQAAEQHWGGTPAASG